MDQQPVEITFRLTPETLASLLSALGTALTGGKEPAAPAGSGENESFDWQRFLTMAGAAAEGEAPSATPDGDDPETEETAILQREETERPQHDPDISVEAPTEGQRQPVSDEETELLPRTETAVSDVEALRQTQWMEPEHTPPSVGSTKNDDRRLSAVYERDARRYDGGFALY